MDEFLTKEKESLLHFLLVTLETIASDYSLRLGFFVITPVRRDKTKSSEK